MYIDSSQLPDQVVSVCKLQLLRLIQPVANSCNVKSIHTHTTYKIQHNSLICCVCQACSRFSITNLLL